MRWSVAFTEELHGPSQVQALEILNGRSHQSPGSFEPARVAAGPRGRPWVRAMLSGFRRDGRPVSIHGSTGGEVSGAPASGRSSRTAAGLAASLARRVLGGKPVPEHMLVVETVRGVER